MLYESWFRSISLLRPEHGLPVEYMPDMRRVGEAAAEEAVLICRQPASIGPYEPQPLDLSALQISLWLSPGLQVPGPA